MTSKPSGLNCAKGQELAVGDHGGNWQGRGFKHFLFIGLKRNTLMQLRPLLAGWTSAVWGF